MIPSLLKKAYLIAVVITNLSPGWSLGEIADIDICLQHDDKKGCAKLRVEIPHVRDGRPITRSDGLPNLINKYKVAISDENQKIQVISDRMAVRDDRGDFLEYDIVEFEGDREATIVPILYNSKESRIPSSGKKPQPQQYSMSFHIFPYDERHEEIKLVLEEDKNSSGRTWHKVGDYYYKIPERRSFPKGNPIEIDDSLSFSNKPLDFSLVFPEELIQSGQPLYPIRQMRFSNEVSVFGTVWSVFNMYERDLIALGERGRRALESLRNRPVTRIFPRMNKEQYDALGFNENEEYEENYENAFHVSKDDANYLCFFPIKKGSHQFTSRSLPTVAHETGHNVFHIIKPSISNRAIEGESDIYSRAFDESFGDCTALFFLLEFEEMRERIFTATQGNLSISSFLSRIANRDATGPIKPLTCIQCEEHDLSEPLTKIIYNILREGSSFIQRVSNKSFSEAITQVSRDLRFLYLSSILEYRYTDTASKFNFADFARIMERQAFNFVGINRADYRGMNLQYLAPFIGIVSREHKIDLSNMEWQFPKCIQEGNDHQLGSPLCKTFLIKQDVNSPL